MLDYWQRSLGLLDISLCTGLLSIPSVGVFLQSKKLNHALVFVCSCCLLLKWLCGLFSFFDEPVWLWMVGRWCVVLKFPFVRTEPCEFSAVKLRPVVNVQSIGNAIPCKMFLCLVNYCLGRGLRHWIHFPGSTSQCSLKASTVIK